MRVPHFAMRPLVAVTLVSLALGGCSSSESSAPSEFNPEGATADLAATQGAFQSPSVEAYAAVSGDISLVMNGAAAVSASAQLVTKAGANPERYVRALAGILPRASGGISAAVAAIPSGALGKTYVWDEVNGVYVASDLTGAPSNGVRFVLYAVNPVTLRPVEPVIEVGYVDLIDQSGTTTGSFRAIVVSGGVTYLDYTVSASGTENSGTVTISGFVTDGETTATFNLENVITNGASGLVITLDYDIDVPSRDLELDYTATLSGFLTETFAVDVNFIMKGSNGWVVLEGSYGNTGGTFTVTVNGDLFATITLAAGGELTVTGADGQPLSEVEE
ncbi:MAG: hypothetical protein ACREMG_07825, partial [Gemmatimonadales bacterium]